MQFIGLHTLLNAKEIQALYPISSENEKVKVSYNLSIPIGVLLQNYGRASQEADVLSEHPPEVLSPECCPCRKYHTDGAIDFRQHVATTDPGFIKDARLRSYWLKGRKFRCQAHPQHLMEAFSTSLDKYITTASKRNKVDEFDFQPWKQKLVDVLRTKCEAIFARENAPFHSFLSKEGSKELHQIHNDMVINCADKSSHDFVLCCKQVYKRLFWEEMHSDHYLPEPRSNAEIWALHSSYSDIVGRPAVKAHRYLYGILKMHKNPVGIRWIAGNHMQDVGEKDKKFPACSLSAAEMMLGGVLRMCMHNLQSKDQRCIKQGYKRYWVVTNVDRVAADIKHNLNALRGQPVFTRDFTRMYTSIPQKELVSTVELAIREVFDWYSEKTGESVEQLRVKVTYPRVGHALATFSQKGFSVQEIMTILQAVCTEVYFQQGDKASVYKQKNGLPMGGKASAELPNLYCYVKESKYIDSLIEKNNLQEPKNGFTPGDI